MAKKISKKKDLLEKKVVKKTKSKSEEKIVTKWVEKDAHVQYVSSRPKTPINERERRPQ